MIIYIGMRNEDDLKETKGISYNLVKNLTRYYGKLSNEDIVYYIGAKNDINIYVMASAKFPKKEEEIRVNIKKIFEAFLPDVSIKVNLDYQKTNPNFDPTMISYGIDASSNDLKSTTKSQRKKPSDEFDYERLSENYEADEPHFTFDQIILPETVMNQIIEAVGIIQVEHKVFDEWGLRSIIPNASSAMSFYGPPGTGKTMAAEAIANKLGKKNT